MKILRNNKKKKIFVLLSHPETITREEKSRKKIENVLTVEAFFWKREEIFVEST